MVRDESFFPEWQTALPEITDAEKQLLDKVKSRYFNLVEYPPFLEKTVQIAILSPLLFLADFFLPPFHIKAEKSTEIITEDEGVIIRGQLDFVVLKERVWLMVIESKEMSYSLEVGLAQLLSYMLASPHPDKPGYGMLTNGGSFTFVKLVREDVPKYKTSRFFELRNPGNELYDVLRVIKRIGQL
ncbi:restriction endonuclease subunit R [Zarconia navalis]|uniref:restriction endonuclease subunit R n=1 Tax=Zarconia navalis TaxID=2992134 RepID=UPI0029C9A640|nr:restriction endonuclease subunit R [Zarconia navalis]